MMNIFQQLPNNLKVRLLISFVQNTAVTSVFPFMTLLLSKLIGSKKAGMILIIGVVFKFISALIGGHISDSLKYKRFFSAMITLFSSMMFLGMGICLYFMENLKDVLLVLFVMVYLTNEICMALNKPIYNAFALDNVTEENRSAYSKMKYWTSNISITLGMALGGLFYANYKIELFLFITMALLINTIILLVFIKESPRNVHALERHFWERLFKNYKTASQNKPFVYLLFSGILILSAEMSLSSYISVRLGKNFHTLMFDGFNIDGIRMLSILMMMNTFIITLFSFMILKLFSKMKPVSILKFAFLFYTCGYTIVMSNNHIVTLVIFMFLATVGEILFSPTFESEKIKVIPENQRGSHSALDGLVLTCAEFIARLYLIIGTVLPPLGMSVIVFAVVSIGFSLLLFTVKRQAAI